MRKMTCEIKPDYYDRFVCTADKCPFTCCQEWKIPVDGQTLRRWKKTVFPGNGKRMDRSVARKGGSEVIALDAKRQCPFLDERKLCGLVLEYGDGMIPESCRIFPRELHTYEDRIEYSLMPSCPAVVDLMYQSGEFVLTGEDGAGEKTDLLREIRTLFLEILREKEIPIETGFLMIFYLALDLLEREQEGEAAVMEALDSYGEDFMQKLRETVESVELDAGETFCERNELLLDFIENYRREGMYADVLGELAESAEQYAGGCGGEKMRAFERACASYRELLRTLLCEELYADCLFPGEGIRHMTVKLQWIAMEYAAICQWLFLKWDREGSLAYEDVREAVVLLFRMTGYEEEEIYEYLENSFESLIWEWGYFALVIGPRMEGEVL